VVNLAGMHNVLNALAAIAIAVELNVPDAMLLKALAEFKGVGRRFQRYGDVAVRAGHHCTMPLMARLGIPGTVRASVAFYNTAAEVDRFVAALEKVKTFV